MKDIRIIIKEVEEINMKDSMDNRVLKTKVLFNLVNNEEILRSAIINNTLVIPMEKRVLKSKLMEQFRYKLSEKMKGKYRIDMYNETNNKIWDEDDGIYVITL